MPDLHTPRTGLLGASPGSSTDKEQPSPRVPPILSIGFRPFFLLGSLYAAIMIPVWLLVLSGTLAHRSHLPPTLWHAHELIYGFVIAIAAGFLLTAVPNWTKTPHLSGMPLLALVSLWLAGRVLMVAGSHAPALLTTGVDVAFLPALASTVARPILSRKQKHNVGFPILLLVMMGCNLWTHAVGLGWVHGGGSQALLLALLIMVLMIVIIGGRIVPLFTQNALFPKVKVRQRDKRDDLAVWLTVAVLITALLPQTGVLAILSGILPIAAGVTVAWRMQGWGSLQTRDVPILWVLHVGYAWVALGLVLLGASALMPGPIPRPAALHALTTGAMGIFILAMLSRVALGHTGRKLEVSRSITLAYLLLILAAVLRTFGPLLLPAWYLPTLHAAGTAWSLAFVLYLWHYTPILLTPRPDGR